MATTVELQGNFDRQDGTDRVAGTLYLTLNRRDFDGDTMIEPGVQQIDLDTAGRFAGVRVWPNDRGRTKSRYRLEYLPAGGSRRELIEAELFVPETGGPHNLSDLLLASAVARDSRIDRIIPITATDFAARQSAGTLSDALYLIAEDAA